MSRADIQAALQTVVAILGETWQYRRRTTGPVASPGYSAWADVTVCASSRSAPPEWDDKRSLWKRVDRTRARVSDALAELHNGDQLRTPDGTVWAVLGIASNALSSGTIAYDCERHVPLRGEAGGGRDGTS